MSLLTRALREEQWDLASLCLMLAVLRMVLRLPPDTVVGLLEALEEGEENAPEPVS